MANKKSLERLVGGILGEQQPMEAKKELPQEIEESLQVSEQLKELLNKERTKDTGRPKKGYSPEIGTKQDETRATFIVNKMSLRKIKYISLMETKQIKAVVKDALSDYIAKWEKENGKINLRNFKG
jgi:hypothetical protein